MNATLVRFVSRLLIAALCCLPFQAQAEMIGTHQANSAAQAQSARASITGQLQAYGLASDQARERVAALTDAEVLSLAERIDSLPAGEGVPGLTIGIILVVIFLIWRFNFSDQAKAEKK